MSDDSSYIQNNPNEDEDQPSTSGQQELVNPIDSGESLFQGENQLYPSRRTAANYNHQNQREVEEVDLPANANIAPPPSRSGKKSRRETVKAPIVDVLGLNLALIEEQYMREQKNGKAGNSSTKCGNNNNHRSSVNIMPVTRDLAEHVSNLIAIGRKPIAITSTKKKLSSYVDNRAYFGWQGDKSTLRDRIAYMFCNDTLADVYFVVGHEGSRERIPAHKFVLSIGSVVFDAMFNGGLTPTNNDEALEIELPDVEPASFLKLLKFLYSDEVDIGPESVMTTLYSAKKYAVPAMENACVDFLKDSLEPDNAFMLLSQSILFDEPELKKQCLDMIDKNTLEALNGEGFLEIDLNTLCEVLTRDGLRIREMYLFQAVIRWSVAECKRRQIECTAENRKMVLEKAIELIRFPLMKIEEFALHVEPAKLLSDREMTQIFKYLAVGPRDRPQLVYSDRPRRTIFQSEYVVSRFQRNENRWGFCGTSDRIKFTVDRRIFVIGFGLFGAISGPHEYCTSIKIIHCGTNKTLAEHDTKFTCDGTSRPCRVCFVEPVEILPGITYIASALIRGPDSYYGTKGLRRIMMNDSDVTFQFTYAAQNNNGTSVEDGQIPEIIYYRTDD